MLKCSIIPGLVAVPTDIFLVFSWNLNIARFVLISDLQRIMIDDDNDNNDNADVCPAEDHDRR